MNKEINIKVGDKLLSKKDSVEFKKDKWYTITQMSNRSKELFSFEIDIARYIYVTDNNSCYSFTFNITNENNENYIWNYFYTPSKLRKEKIKKLNE